MQPLTPQLQCWPLLSLPCSILAEKKRQRVLLFPKLLKQVQHNTDGKTRGMVQEIKVPDEAVPGLVSGSRPWDIPFCHSGAPTVTWQFGFSFLHSSLPCNSALTSKKHIRLVRGLGKGDCTTSTSDPLAALRHLLLLLFCKLPKGTHRAQGQLVSWVPPRWWLLLVAQSLYVSFHTISSNTPSSDLLQIIPVPSATKFFSGQIWRHWWDDPPNMRTSSAQAYV